MKRKIAVIIPSLRGGGAERVMTNIVNHLDKEKFEIRLIIVNKVGPYEKLLSADIEIIDLKSLRVRHAVIKLIKELNKFQPDIILSTLGHLNLVILIIRRFLKKNPKIVIREANTPSKSLLKLPKLKREVFRQLYKYFYPTADIIIAQCEDMQKDIISYFGIKKNKVRYIYNPIDTKKIANESKKTNPYNENVVNIVAIGRLTYQKGFDILINAIQKVIIEVPNLKLTILGEGELKKELNNQVKELKLEKYVEIIGFKENPYPYYNYADLYVLSSRWEGFPNTLIEALACNVKVVATNCKSGPREILSDIGYSGLVETENEGKLAKMIVEILDSNRKYDKKYLRNYDISNVIKKYEELLLS